MKSKGNDDDDDDLEERWVCTVKEEGINNYRTRESVINRGRVSHRLIL